MRLTIGIAPFRAEKVARIVVTGTLLTAILEYFASSVWMYGMTRLTFGLTRACVTVANGMICDLVADPKERSKAMGKNFSAMGIGFLLGSALGGVMASPLDGYHAALLCNFGISLLSFVWTFTFLEETSKSGSASKSSSSSSPSSSASAIASSKASLLGALREILSNSDLRSLFLFHAMVLICNISPQHAYFEFMRLELELSTTLRGLFLVAVGVVSVAAQSTFSIVLSKLGMAKYVAMCIIGAAVSNFVAPLGGFALFTTATLAGTFFGVVSSTSLSTLSNASPAHLAGTVNGLHESLSNLALVIGGLYVPITYAMHMYAPFWISSFAFVFTIILLRPKLLFSQEPSKHKKTQ